MERRNFIVHLASLGLLSLVNVNRLFGQKVGSSDNYVIEHFEDKGLAHYSYAIMADYKIILVDPVRNPKKYYDYAKRNNAQIIGIIETHPHADFVSSHLEIHQKLGVPIYSSSLTNANYPRTVFDDGDLIRLSDRVVLRSMYTPGHAPDHLSVILVEGGKEMAVFSGDSLLIGDTWGGFPVCQISTQSG